MKRIIFIFFITTLVACSTKERPPSNVLSKNEMQSVLWDVIRAQFLAQHNARKDSTINLNAETRILTDKVFNIHKITSKDFDRSYNWYTAHPDQFQVMMDSLYTQKQREFNPNQPETNSNKRKLVKPYLNE